MLHAHCRAGHCRDMGDPLPVPRAALLLWNWVCFHQGTPQHCRTGQDRTAQDTSLKAALCRGFCYNFPEQEQQEHSPPWELPGGNQHSCLEAPLALSQQLGRASCVPEQPAVVTVSPPWGYMPAACTQKHPMGQRKKPNIQKRVAFSRDLGSRQKLKLFSPRKPVDFHRIEMSVSLVFP